MERGSEGRSGRLGEFIERFHRFGRPSPSHASTLPGVAIFLLVIGFNLVGDSLRDALDPRTRLVRVRMADGNRPEESAG